MYFAELIPGGREAEFMGLKKSVSTCFKWISPTLWIACTNAGWDLNSALLVGAVSPFVVSLLFVLPVSSKKVSKVAWAGLARHHNVLNTVPVRHAPAGR